MKLILQLFAWCILAFICSNSYAARETLPEWMRPFYLGAEAGYSYANYTNSDLSGGFVASSFNNGGLGAHPFLGYNFNRYIAAELAVFYFSRPVVNGVPSSGDSVKLRHNILGVFAKGTYPFNKDWSVFAKAGLGYVARSGMSVGNTQVLPQGLFFSPQFALGVAYQFYKQWFVDASANFALANNQNQLPLSTFYGIGIYYEFGDKFI